MATFSIGSSGSQLALNTPRKIGTLDANTYPCGTLTFNNLQSGGAYWNHNSTNDEWFAVYLTNSDHTIWSNKLFEMHCVSGLTSDQLFANKTVQVDFEDIGIAGQDLYLIAYRWDGSGYNDLSSPAFRIMNYTGISLETSLWYTHCSQPTNVQLTSPELNKLKLSWNNAYSGSHNPVAGYEVCLTATVDGAAVTEIISLGDTVTNYTFTVNNSNSYYGWVRTIGTYGYHSNWVYDGPKSALMYTSCTAPTSVSMTRDGNGKIKVSWSGAGGGANNSITGYRIELGQSAVQVQFIYELNSTSSSGSYTFTVNNTTEYYAAVQTQGQAGGHYYSDFTTTSSTLSALYYSPPNNIAITRDGENKLKVSWSGAGVSAISSYTVYLSTTSGGNAASGLSTTVTTNATSGSYTFTTNNATAYYAAVRTNGTYSSSYAWSTGNLGAATRVTAPTSVTASVSGTTVTISWSGASNGNNNTITNYKVIRNTSASESGATVVSNSATSPITNNPGSGSYYYGVRTQGSAGAGFESASYKWSGKATVSGKPSVAANTSIDKSDMDALRTYLGKGTAVSIGGQITRAIAITYKDTAITAGTTKVNASWFNN